MRWPGVTQAGSRQRAAFTSMIDLFPTFCEAAGVNLPDDTDGRSLVPLLRGDDDPDRDFTVSVFHETFAKNRYEMRCVQDHATGYNWNAWSDGATHYRAENMFGLTWPAMLEAAANDDALARRTRFYVNRQPEELYDLSTDPSCLHDLHAAASHREQLDTSRDRLLAWMEQTAAGPLLIAVTALAARQRARRSGGCQSTATTPHPVARGPCVRQGRCQPSVPSPRRGVDAQSMSMPSTASGWLPSHCRANGHHGTIVSRSDFA